MTSGTKHVVIAGGGITGLAAAYYTHKLSDQRGLKVRITLLEQSHRLGGRIRTLRRDGHVIEQGPDSFLARKQPIIDLTRELGLVDELVPTNPKAKKTYVLHQRQLHRIPPGLVLGVPTQWTPFLKTKLISSRGKLRAAMDVILPRGPLNRDESLGHFFERRLGKEVLERMADPILAGIYSGDMSQLSLLATFPQFREAERAHRSLILGMMHNQRKAREMKHKVANQATSESLPDSVKHSVFLSYRHGLSTLIEKLESYLSPHVQWQLGETLQSVSVLQENDQTEAGGIKLQVDDGTSQSDIHADALILALPAAAYGKLFPNWTAAQQFSQMGYISVANVVFAYEASKVNHPLDGSGFVISRAEKRFITACTWTSSKWGHTAPQGRVLIRCYVGRAGEEGWMDLDDKQIVANVKRELQELLGIDAEPDFVDINRHLNAMPQYGVGHLDRVKQFRETLAEQAPGVYVTGSAFGGVGIPDCIQQGKEAAEQMLSNLR